SSRPCRATTKATPVPLQFPFGKSRRTISRKFTSGISKRTVTRQLRRRPLQPYVPLPWDFNERAAKFLLLSLKVWQRHANCRGNERNSDPDLPGGGSSRLPPW